MKTIKPGKQRKKLYQAPLNRRSKFFSAPLSSKLKLSHNTKSLTVRKGDTIMIMRGDRKGLEGKITQIDKKNYRIFIEGITREKVDGTTTLIPIHPSKVMITKLNLDDKWRKKILERKSLSEKAEKEKESQKKNNK